MFEDTESDSKQSFLSCDLSYYTAHRSESSEVILAIIKDAKPHLPNEDTDKIKINDEITRKSYQIIDNKKIINITIPINDDAPKPNDTFAIINNTATLETEEIYPYVDSNQIEKYLRLLQILVLRNTQ